jgi:3-dehydroquinate synthetase
MTTSEVLAGCPEFTFPYHIGSRCSGAIGDEIRRMSPDRVVVIADENVLNLHGASLDALRDAVDTKIVVVPNGEQAKTASVLISVLSESIELGVTRRSVVVTFGGGVLSVIWVV